MATQTIITGLQPSGELHIGNYISAIEPLLELQKKYECLLFVADLHAMTVPYDPKSFPQRIKDLVTIYLASGIDPKKCLIFLQSRVPQHTELAWILGTTLPMSELERMTQYKEKVEQGKPTNWGLFSYPVLMAADILLYDADLVPVGQDQVQHVELTRVAARKFNKKFGKALKEPKVLLQNSARIIGLDGKGKMSKSLGNSIPLLATAEEIRKKIRKAVVKPNLPRHYEGKRPITIFEWHDQQFGNKTTQALSRQCHKENRNCEAYKELVAKNIAAYLAPLQQKYQQIKTRGDDYLARLLASNAEIARSRADHVLERVRTQTGLRGQ